MATSLTYALVGFLLAAAHFRDDMVQRRTGLLGAAQKANKTIKTGGATKTAKAASSNSNIAENTSRKAVIDWMDKHPEQTINLWAQLESGLVAAPSQKNKVSDEWPNSYIYWRQIPKYWMAQIVIDEAKRFGVTTEMLDEVDAADRDAFRRVMHHLFGLNPHHTIPKPLLMKPVMRRWLLARLASLGNRHQNLSKAIKTDFSVDWARYGAFTFQAGAEGAAPTIHHSVLGQVALPPQLNFGSGEGWTILDNHDDDSAKIDCGFTQVYLKNMFQRSGRDKDFWAMFGAKQQRDAADSARQLFDEHVSTCADDPALLTKAKEKQAAARAARAKDLRKPKTGLSIELEIPASASA